METELTKTIKKLTHTYRPKMGTKTKANDAGRTIRWADEVWTPHGIVDSIRFEDYIVSRHEDCKKERNGDSCKMEDCTHPNQNCRGCIYLHRDDPVIGIYPKDCTDFTTTGLVGDLMPIEAQYTEEKNGISEIVIKMPYDEYQKWKAVRNDCIIKAEIPVRVPPVIDDDEYANSVDVFST